MPSKEMSSQQRGMVDAIADAKEFTPNPTTNMGEPCRPGPCNCRCTPPPNCTCRCRAPEPPEPLGKSAVK